jgi:hypothetical protein
MWDGFAIDYDRYITVDVMPRSAVNSGGDTNAVNVVLSLNVETRAISRALVQLCITRGFERW